MWAITITDKYAADIAVFFQIDFALKIQTSPNQSKTVRVFAALWKYSAHGIANMFSF